MACEVCLVRYKKIRIERDILSFQELLYNLSVVSEDTPFYLSVDCFVKKKSSIVLDRGLFFA